MVRSATSAHLCKERRRTNCQTSHHVDCIASVRRCSATTTTTVGSRPLLMSSKRAFEGINGPSCPCCLERLAFTGSKYQPAADNLADLCSTCVEIGDSEYDLPPFLWATTVAEIEASTASVLEAAEANLKAVAAADPPTFATVIKPLMLAPNYKTNPFVCASKFLQHGSPDAALREAAEAAGKKFAAFKAAARTRSDVFDKVQAFAATPEAKSLGPYEAHYVEALLADFRRGGLALTPDGRKELQRLLDADAEACAGFGSI